MEIRSKTTEKRSLFNDEKINQIYQEYYNLNYDLSFEEMEEFLKNIDWHLHDDFLVIKMFNEEKEKELFRLQIQRISFALFGFRKKSFDKYLENGFKIEKLGKDMGEYFENFALDLDELENSLINSFKLYYEIGVCRPGYKEYIIEIYTTYKIMIASIIHMLPESYREDLLSSNYFNSLKNDLECLESYEDFTTSHRMAFDIKKFDSILRNYLQNKFDVDLYDYARKRERNLD